MTTRKEPRIVTLTAAEIGAVQERKRCCAWCRGSAADGYQTTTGIALCGDCADLAREVGDGILSVEHVTYDGISYTISPPLVLALSVQHDDSGYRWMQATAPDMRDVLGQMLGDEHNWDTPALSVVDRAEASSAVAACLVSPDAIRYLLDELADLPDQGTDPADEARRERYQRQLDAIRTRITPPPVPAPTEDEDEDERA
jgi:hypothetical protein